MPHETPRRRSASNRTPARRSVSERVAELVALANMEFRDEEIQRVNELTRNWPTNPGAESAMEGRQTSHREQFEQLGFAATRPVAGFQRGSYADIPSGATAIDSTGGYARLIRTNVPDTRDLFPDETSPRDQWWNSEGRRGLTPGDHAIVDDARISTAQADANRPWREDRNLIRYLMRHRHTTPFEAPDFTIEIKAPIFVARQAMRHRTFSDQEVSLRYTPALVNDYYLPNVDAIRQPSTENRQGGGAVHEAATTIRRDLDGAMDIANATYAALIGNPERNETPLYGEPLASEMARIVLPLSTYTTWRRKGNLWNWLHFLSLRLDPHAQQEIRWLAEAIYSIIQPLVPLAVEAWELYHRDALTLSRDAARAIADLLDRAGALDVLADGETDLFQQLDGRSGISAREAREVDRAIRAISDRGPDIQR